MSLLHHSLAALAADGPTDLDRVAGAALAVCRDLEHALREAHARGDVRALRPAVREAVAAALPDAGAVAASGAELEHLAGALAFGDREHAVAAAARALAEELDERFGARFAAAYARRRRWRLAPDAPFPVIQPSLRELFRGRRLTTHPDRRTSLPVDRTRRLALAPRQSAFELELSFAAAHALPPPTRDAAMLVAFPVSSAAAFERVDVEAPRGFRLRHRDPAASASALVRALEEAAAIAAHAVVAPELTVAPEAAAAAAAWMAAHPGPPHVVVAGSAHVDHEGVPRNLATILTAGGRAHYHTKFNPFAVDGDRLEAIAVEPRALRVQASLDELGVPVWGHATLLCKDFLADEIPALVGALRPALVLVPAMTDKTEVFEQTAVALLAAAQAMTLLANFTESAGQLIALLTRPVDPPGPDRIARSGALPHTLRLRLG